MRDGEGGDGPQQNPSAPHDQDQCKHEQQMVKSEKDVLDSVQDVGARHRQQSGRGRDLNPRAVRPYQGGRDGAVAHLYVSDRLA